MVLWVMFTNQIHKWAHTKNPPQWVIVLQKYKLFLSPQHHRIHHTPPFESQYCITTGWLNGLLNRINFFRVLETVITRITGSYPRQDESVKYFK